MTEKTSNAMPASDPLLINPGFTSGTPIDIDAVRRMADDAGTRLVTIYPTDAFGLPGEVPILINRKNGSASSIRSLIEEYREKPRAQEGHGDRQHAGQFSSPSPTATRRSTAPSSPTPTGANPR